MRILAIAALCAAIGGCATKYQETGFTGNAATQRITADTWRILASSHEEAVIRSRQRPKITFCQRPS
jgi:hypothetical protein